MKGVLIETLDVEHIELHMFLIRYTLINCRCSTIPSHGLYTWPQTGFQGMELLMPCIGWCVDMSFYRGTCAWGQTVGVEGESCTSIVKMS